MDTNQPVHAAVQDYYGKLLRSNQDLKTTAVSCCGRITSDIISNIIPKIPPAFYGCGNPIPLGIEGKRVLDLGSGSGRDCYIAAALVGVAGEVIGIDMTEEQLRVASDNIPDFAKTLGFTPNVRFVKGYIEALQAAGIQKETVDICISNCVINLSPNKRRILEGVYSALVDGGEMYFSDIYASTRLSESVRTHPILFGECMAGAFYIEDFQEITKEIGFETPLQVQSTAVQIQDPELRALVGDTTFQSITFRLFKLPNSVDHNKETNRYFVTYSGGIKGHETDYLLDKDNIFVIGRAVEVTHNVANIIKYSWLEPHFISDWKELN